MRLAGRTAIVTGGGRGIGRATCLRFAAEGARTQIQKNIVGERMLGLPRESSVDRDVLFKDLLVGTQKRPRGPGLTSDYGPV